MQNKIIIGLVGEKGSGKGSAAEIIIEEYKAVHYGTSKILRRTIEDLHLPVSRENLTKLALVLKEGFWPSVVIDSLIKDIENNGSDIIIADGIRMPGDIEPFRKKYGDNFYLVYVTADIKIRYQRTKKRKEKAGEDKLSFEEFLAEESKLTEISIHEIGKQADFKINNNGSPEELKERIVKVMANIIKQPV